MRLRVLGGGQSWDRERGLPPLGACLTSDREHELLAELLSGGVD